jgi:hypothetical protein
MHKTFGNGRNAGLFLRPVLFAFLLFVPFLFFTACPEVSDPAETGNDIIKVTLQKEVPGDEEGTVKKEDVPETNTKVAFIPDINEIEITVRPGNPIAKLYLKELEVSEGAVTTPPAEDLAKALIDPVEGKKITVTAEDGSEKVWKITVKKDPLTVIICSYVTRQFKCNTNGVPCK